MYNLQFKFIFSLDIWVSPVEHFYLSCVLISYVHFSYFTVMGFRYLFSKRNLQCFPFLNILSNSHEETCLFPSPWLVGESLGLSLQAKVMVALNLSVSFQVISRPVCWGAWNEHHDIMVTLTLNLFNCSQDYMLLLHEILSVILKYDTKWYWWNLKMILLSMLNFPRKIKG